MEFKITNEEVVVEGDKEEIAIAFFASMKINSEICNLLKAMVLAKIISEGENEVEEAIRLLRQGI